MSRVTIESLYSDFTVPRTEARQWGMNYEQYKCLANTEIVPRKMVEMIIEKCNEENKYVNNSYYSRKINNIREYAELLLKQFEEGNNESKNADENT